MVMSFAGREPAIEIFFGVEWINSWLYEDGLGHIRRPKSWNRAIPRVV